MFGRTKTTETTGPPQKAFVHSDDCKLVRVDSGLEIPWNEVRAGDWEARCVCGVEGWHAPDAGRGPQRPHTTRRPPATEGSASSSARPMRPCFGSC
jgi:hypothetical protein